MSKIKNCRNIPTVFCVYDKVFCSFSIPVLILFNDSSFPNMSANSMAPPGEVGSPESAVLTGHKSCPFLMPNVCTNDISASCILFSVQSVIFSSTGNAAFKLESAISSVVFIFLCTYKSVLYSGNASKKSTSRGISFNVSRRF